MSKFRFEYSLKGSVVSDIDAMDWLRKGLTGTRYDLPDEKIAEGLLKAPDGTLAPAKVSAIFLVEEDGETLIWSDSASDNVDFNALARAVGLPIPELVAMIKETH